jgi:hypothetical protein
MVPARLRERSANMPQKEIGEKAGSESAAHTDGRGVSALRAGVASRRHQIGSHRLTAAATLRRGALVSRFRSSHHCAAASFANFGSEGH